jgi:hypothetical protein
MISLNVEERSELSALRLINQAYDQVYFLYKAKLEQGMTIADLANRTGKSQKWLQRKLQGPSGWKLSDIGVFCEGLGAFTEIKLVPMRQD